jgi:RNA polymerase sigma factor (sigma-70 family)
MHASHEESSRVQVRDLSERLYRERYRYLLGIARRNAADADAEEAVQFAFLAFMEHFNPEGGAPPLAWLTLTLKRECWMRNRRSSRNFSAEVPIAAEAPGPEESIERSEAVVEAREALGQLKPAERRAIGLIAAGYSYREVGEITGWTYTKINRCASEGRAALRNIKSMS